MKDLFGKAILDFQTNNDPQDLITETSISETDEMSVAYLFRSFSEMPDLEKKALGLSKGKILDVGCGAGSHSLYLQNERGLDVTAIDISENAIKACKLRGLKKAKVLDIMEVIEKFDTILLMMNGAGMCGKLTCMPAFLQKLKSLLNPGGQILLDSSDIIYMFDEDEDSVAQAEGDLTKATWDAGENYYGEVVFNISYKNEEEIPFDWMYVDYNTLQTFAESAGLQCGFVLDGAHYDYLARLTL